MANDVHQLIIAGFCSGQHWECVQHFEANVAVAMDPVVGSNNLISGFKSSCEGFLTDIMSEDCAIIGYKANRVNNGGGPTVMSPQAAVPGQLVSQALPSAMAYLFTQRYPQAGKWRSGHMFVPGIPESFSEDNGYTAGAIAAAADFLAELLSFSDGGIGYTWGTWAATAGVFFPPSYAAIAPKIGVQRRRLLPQL